MSAFIAFNATLQYLACCNVSIQCPGCYNVSLRCQLSTPSLLQCLPSIPSLLQCQLWIPSQLQCQPSIFSLLQWQPSIPNLTASKVVTQIQHEVWLGISGQAKKQVLSRLHELYSMYTKCVVQWSLWFKTPLFNNSLHFKTGYQWHHFHIVCINIPLF